MLAFGNHGWIEGTQELLNIFINDYLFTLYNYYICWRASSFSVIVNECYKRFNTIGHIYSLKKSTWQMQVFSRKVWKDEKVHWAEPNQTWTSILLAVKSSVTHTNFNTEPISQNYSSQFSGQCHPKQPSGANYGTEKLVLDIFISQITLMLPRSLFDFVSNATIVEMP